MLQVNPGPYPLVLPTLDPPQTVAPGGQIEHDELLPGFEPVEVVDTAAKSVRPPKTAAAAATDAKEA